MKKGLFIIFLILGCILFLVISSRLFSKEDTWICSDGKWVAHGRPTTFKPKTKCK